MGLPSLKKTIKHIKTHGVNKSIAQLKANRSRSKAIKAQNTARRRNSHALHIKRRK